MNPTELPIQIRQVDNVKIWVTNPFQERWSLYQQRKIDLIRKDIKTVKTKRPINQSREFIHNLTEFSGFKFFLLFEENERENFHSPMVDGGDGSNGRWRKVQWCAMEVLLEW